MKKYHVFLGFLLVSLIAFVLIGCPNPNNSSTTDDSSTGDTPTPGSDGTLTTADVTVNSMTVTWTKASDDETAAADLQYKAVYSESDNLDTVSNAEDKGTTFQDWSADIDSATLEGLSRDTTYYVNVLVKDEAGNKDLYSRESETTLWTIIAGGSGYEQGRGMTMDSGWDLNSEGNFYLVGTTDEGFDDNNQIGSKDVYYIKYNASGEKVWSKRFGEDGVSFYISQYGAAATDSDDNLYIAGEVDAAFDENSHTGSGANVFLLKFDSSGEKLDSTIWGATTGYTYKPSLHIDADNNLYLTGQVYNGTPPGGSSEEAFHYDGYLVKFDTNLEQETDGAGDPELRGQFNSDLGGPGTTDEAIMSTSDADGNIYVTGYVEGDFDGHTSSGGEDTFDAFVVKYDSSGTQQWSRLFGTAGDERPNTIEVDSSSVYIAYDIGYSEHKVKKLNTSDGSDDSSNPDWDLQGYTDATCYASDVDGNLLILGLGNEIVAYDKDTGEFDVNKVIHDGSISIHSLIRTGFTTVYVGGTVLTGPMDGVEIQGFDHFLGEYF